ncbi:MAG: alpha/beta hydrolase family protein [Phycisphaerae bacterium]
MKRTPFTAVSVMLLLAGSTFAATTTAPAIQPTTYHGYSRENFTLDSCDCILVSPKTAAPGNPWIWRAKFFGAYDQLDRALLAKGYHLAYMEIGNTFGAPAALAHWQPFYKEMTETRHLNKKPIMEGLSRGGLYIFNWAAQNPDKVSLLIADNAVLDFKTWPGDHRADKTKKDWQAMLNAYHFKTDDEALNYKLNPVDNLEPLAAAHIPIFFLAADADTLVSFEKNAKLAYDRYTQLGGPCILHIKHGMDHHPHSLDDPSPILQFIDEHTPR